MTDKTVFFEIFIEEDYEDYDDDYYDDYDYDDEKVKIPGAEKQKAGKWIDDLDEDEAVAGMLKEKVDDMVRKMVKMKVRICTCAKFQLHMLHITY